MLERKVQNILNATGFSANLIFMTTSLSLKCDIKGKTYNVGGLAQMVERPLSMWEAPRSILGFSITFAFLIYGQLQFNIK